MVVHEAEGPYRVAIATEGSRAAHEIAVTSPLPCDFMETEIEADLPDKSGFHVWIGAIHVDQNDPRQLATWIGQWRRARLADFGRFGFPVPTGEILVGETG